MPSRLSRREKALSLLSDKQPHTTKECARRIGHSFAGALYALRQEGYIIHAWPHPTRLHQWQYQLDAALLDES